ncbi:hypothetical protein [Ferrimonas sp. YFM]|uniref:hypothetical protein n=1 Tax=Ferrimonas sp. YFM TaxID=3028878 RepID=UPI002573086B|nr:hypothetical protein [Ferrimonas sp. YFM]BDY07055.1 hypothetical protein F0521_40960 [Ferrimonas sp. YFM]
MMEVFEGKVLLKSLIKRFRKVEEDSYELRGTLTDDEMSALRLALNVLSSEEPSVTVEKQATFELDSSNRTIDDTPKTQVEDQDSPSIEIDLSVLDLPEASEGHRLCLDFGTAMSKVTLVRDTSGGSDFEEIEVLTLGIPGDQEEISETMLISSVFIDQEGYLWFGKSAVDRSRLEKDGRQRLDNIKRYLSEEGFSSIVSERFNPTSYSVTYGDMILANLMYLTWTANQCLAELGEPKNVIRRYAMPCLELSKSRDTAQLLGSMLGEAQILADTFSNSMQDGIPINKFVEIVYAIREKRLNYPFIAEDITEPLGVAGSLISWTKSVNSLVMVIDVGAGTSDFSVFRMRYDENTKVSTALEVADSNEGITEAGNHLDNLLKGFILSKSEVDHTHEHWLNVLGNLELDLRDHKERLFLSGEVSVRLFTDELVTVTIDEFLALEQVKSFGRSLTECRDRILSRIDSSFTNGAPNGALGIALTGGGAELPMVKELAKGSVYVRGKELQLARAPAFPLWLQEEYPDLEEDYPRIAVSLGGAREKIIERNGVANVTAGDVRTTPRLEGYYTRGQ